MFDQFLTGNNRLTLVKNLIEHFKIVERRNFNFGVKCVWATGVGGVEVPVEFDQFLTGNNQLHQQLCTPDGMQLPNPNYNQPSSQTPTLNLPTIYRNNNSNQQPHVERPFVPKEYQNDVDLQPQAGNSIILTVFPNNSNNAMRMNSPTLPIISAHSSPIQFLGTAACS